MKNYFENIKNIPLPLIKNGTGLRKQFVYSDLNKKGSQAKAPLNPNLKKTAFAKTNAPASWGTFEQAVKRAKEVKGKKHGIVGFVFSQDDPYTVIDFDHPLKRAQNGKIPEISPEFVKRWESWVCRWIDQFDSYTEVSLSGLGYHVILEGRLKTETGLKFSNIGVEIYSWGRYMVLSGWVNNAKVKIEKRQGVLGKFLKSAAELELKLKGESPSAAPVRSVVSHKEGDPAEHPCSYAAKAPSEFLKKFLKSDKKLNKLYIGHVNISGWKNVESHINSAGGTPYPSMSEADFAFFTKYVFLLMRAYPDWQNQEIVQRVLEAYSGSALGRRKRAEKRTNNATFLSRAEVEIKNAVEVVLKNKAKKPLKSEKPLKNDCQVLTEAAEKIDTEPDPEGVFWEGRTQIEYPAGLIGDTAAYINETSLYPIREAGIVAALGLVAGITGNSYNVLGNGLNIYIVLVAPSGTGKEGITRGVNEIKSYFRNRDLKEMKKLISDKKSNAESTKDVYKTYIENFIVEHTFASGQALANYMTKQDCFVSIMTEFGQFYKKICNPRATYYNEVLKNNLTEMFTKSGVGKLYGSAVYANLDKNSKPILSPALSIIGACTPRTLYDHFSAEEIESGLISRLLLVETRRKNIVKPKLWDSLDIDENSKDVQEFEASETDGMIGKGFEIVLNEVRQLRNKKSIRQIGITADSKKLLDEFANEVTELRNTKEDEIRAILANRAIEYSLKIAGALTVGRDPKRPVILPDAMEWAIFLAKRSVGTTMDRFDSGEVGTGDSRRFIVIKQLFDQWIAMGKKEKIKHGRTYGLPEAIYTLSKTALPASYIHRRLKTNAAFTNQRLGYNLTLKNTLDAMKDVSLLQDYDDFDRKFNRIRNILEPGPAFNFYYRTSKKN